MEGTEKNVHCFGAMCDELGPGCVTPPAEQGMKVEFDGERNTVTVNGVAICLEVLKVITDPDPRAWLRFERQGDVVTVHMCRFDPRPEYV
jgi:hypothetical protein